ncbi:hypothetical protein K458DRAFT_47775 [Lentithecium fluviatile CBS 122367]|uniref:Uncharacterized protein n=1 Tax=Lentithecium fluviatile CBS 122367 TaxID=1168545 RepID=A0A6G1IZY7_9PLEO|nr:hypothetical protein K458DRAFT_47775 [Lentithecium fluviatile CBS 122367]
MSLGSSRRRGGRSENVRAGGCRDAWGARHTRRRVKSGGETPARCKVRSAWWAKTGTCSSPWFELESAGALPCGHGDDDVRSACRAQWHAQQSSGSSGQKKYEDVGREKELCADDQEGRWKANACAGGDAVDTRPGCALGLSRNDALMWRGSWKGRHALCGLWSRQSPTKESQKSKAPPTAGREKGVHDTRGGDLRSSHALRHASSFRLAARSRSCSLQIASPIIR